MDGDEGSSDRTGAGGLRRGSSAASDHTDDGSNGKSRKSSDHRSGGQFIHPVPIEQQVIDASVDAVIYKKDAWVYAQDQKNDWYVARMYAARETSNGQEIKVHYRGWNTRYDIFLPLGRLRAYNGPVLDADKDAETFSVGDFVGARWGGKTFPAKILEFLTVDGEESAKVLFDDGFEKAVRIKTLSKLPGAQLAKIDMATFGRNLVLKSERTSFDDDKHIQELAQSNERVKHYESTA
uniref:Tudor domain-containing protein n=1 Tax=Plectus sambesii TaxID=2011161 RepID=A0A914ULT2_9BILA